MPSQKSTAYISFDLSDTTGRMNLDGSTVEIAIRRNEERLPIVKPCNVLDPSAGTFSVKLSPEDLSEAGTYKLQVKVVHQDGSVTRPRVVSLFVDESIE